MASCENDGRAVANVEGAIGSEFVLQFCVLGLRSNSGIRDQSDADSYLNARMIFSVDRLWMQLCRRETAHYV
jgi:hypothetical protein